MKSAVFVALFLTLGSLSSFAQANDQRTRAKSILDAARQSVQASKQLDGLVVTGSILRITKLDNGTAVVDTGEFEDSFDLKGQRVKLKETVDQGTSKLNGPVESSGIRISTNELVNGTLAYSNSDVRKEGVKLVLPLGTPTREELESSLKGKAFLRTFPFVLRVFYAAPSEDFTFGGIAESKDQRADIVTITTQGIKYLYYFDQRTHQLLMMTCEFAEKTRSTSVKQYFSNYKEFDGRLVPTTIKMESQISLTDNSHRTVTETYEIKDLKFDPVFKTSIFK